MFYFKLTILLLATAGWLSKPVVTTETVITCDDDKNVHRLSCDYGVISVTSSLYGRADKKICEEGRSKKELSNTKCSLKGTTELVKMRCNNKKVCEINRKTDIGTSDPCDDTFKYIETNFICLPAIHRIICEGSVAFLHCDKGQVIHVYGANYGRHDKTTCSYRVPNKKIQNTSCSKPTTKVAEECNGKRHCSVKVSDSVFGKHCEKTYKYLELAYVCDYPVHY